MSAPTVFIYVQNLLGIGHVRRSAAIAHAAFGRGFEVIFVSGGMPVDGIHIECTRFYQLPPVRSLDGNFKTLVDDQGIPIDNTWRRKRREQLKSIFEETRPEILLTELFPFGRRQFRFELIPLLAQAKQAKWKPKIVCSMRDILVTKSRKDRNLEIVKTLNLYYDVILVHGDEKIITLDKTFPLNSYIQHLIRYTGYVLNPIELANTGTVGTGEIIVSLGGGAVGATTLIKLFNLRKNQLNDNQPWRFILGPHMPAEVAEKIIISGEKDIIIEHTRPDLPSVICRADLSISQGGYNTIAEVLATRTPAIVIPFEGGVETEQRFRADLLAQRNLIQVIYENDLSSVSLSAAIKRASKTRRTNEETINLNGADNTAKIFGELL
ncbi:MAG: hypothetical protein CMM58_08075 [Rhodospirillaceae bacterium]|nr:hypothetical protein [Rhodospirillaceae bacterium]|tara:strand:- start:1785 stop:2927 length:1143 start_codon:yes stop_codon:yes gene_type:complete